MKLDFDTIKNKNEASIDRVAQWLNLNLKKRGQEWFGYCPLPQHTEKTPSFTVGGKKQPNSFYCFGCGASGDCFDLVSSLTGLSKYESLLWIADRAGMDVKKTASGKHPGGEPYRISTAAVPDAPVQKSADIYPADKNLHDEVYRAIIENLPLEDWAKSNIESRGGDSTAFFGNLYRSLPTNPADRCGIAADIAADFKLSEQRRVAGLFQLPDGKWCFAGDRRGSRTFSCYLDKNSIKLDIPGMLVPSLSIDNKVQYLKIRNPSFPYSRFGIDETTYRKWSQTENAPAHSLFEKLKKSLQYYPPKYQVVTSNDRPMGCSVEVSPHFSRFSRFNADSFILTEGELKADLIAGYTGLPVISLPGVNLNHDKILGFLNQEDAPETSFLYGNEDVKSLKTITELYKISPFDYEKDEMRLIIEKFSNPTISFAFDRDNSQAVVTSLNKFRLMQSRINKKYDFVYLFWDETKAKGLDDLLQSNETYSYLPFDRIFNQSAGS